MSIFRNVGCSKIVSVKLDNGTEYQVDDDCLRRYLENRFHDEAGNVLGVSSETIKATIKAFAQIQREEKSETNSKNASGQKCTVTKDELLAFKCEYEKCGKTHGWQTDACKKFLIDPKTLRAILTRT